MIGLTIGQTLGLNSSNSSSTGKMAIIALLTITILGRASEVIIQGERMATMTTIMAMLQDFKKSIPLIL